MTDKKKPAGTAIPDGLKCILELLHYPPNRMNPKGVILYLHVQTDGDELWFDTPPNGLLATPVLRLDGWEYCAMPMGRRIGEPPEMTRAFRPYGDGWRERGTLPDGIRAVFTRRML